MTSPFKLGKSSSDPTSVIDDMVVVGEVEIEGDVSEEENRVKAVLGEGEAGEEPISESVLFSLEEEPPMSFAGG